MTDAAASERLKAMNARFAALTKAAPQALGSFRSLMLEASKPGTLQTKFKELIAVAIAVHHGCGDCILFHVSNAKFHGATRSELAETLAVCIEMGGGPSSVYAGHALAAYDDIQ
jgi:AhpD family alkylhydroperoxidase